MEVWRKDYCIKLGQHLKKLIAERNLDPQTVASMANIESKQVYRIISAENEPKVASLLPIAKALNVHVKVLYDFDYAFDKE